MRIGVEEYPWAYTEFVPGGGRDKKMLTYPYKPRSPWLFPRIRPWAYLSEHESWQLMKRQ